VVSYYDKALAFEFSTFDFVSPERIVYDYQLEGFNTAWTSTPAGVNRIGYTNLNPGTYRLKVRAHTGESSSRERILTLIIVPAWYQTWWAIFYLYCFLRFCRNIADLIFYVSYSP
jgi:Y_Y_Y domain.